MMCFWICWFGLLLDWFLPLKLSRTFSLVIILFVFIRFQDFCLVLLKIVPVSLLNILFCSCFIFGISLSCLSRSIARSTVSGSAARVWVCCPGMGLPSLRSFSLGRHCCVLELSNWILELSPAKTFLFVHGYHGYFWETGDFLSCHLVMSLTPFIFY